MIDSVDSQLANANTRDPPKVAIIILNWNSWKKTIECLESLYLIDYPSYEIILVDNGSKDGSVGKIMEYAAGKIRVDSKFFQFDTTNKPLNLIKPTSPSRFNKELILIQNKENQGFAEGVNIGLRLIQKHPPDYVLLLNNDIVVGKRFLTELINSAEASPKIGIAGPTIYYYDNQTTVAFAGENLTLWKVKGKEYPPNQSIPEKLTKSRGHVC